MLFVVVYCFATSFIIMWAHNGQWGMGDHNGDLCCPHWSSLVGLGHKKTNQPFLHV
jgi:hypothetical protein